MEQTPRSDISSITAEALKHPKSTNLRKPLLPPILCEKDKALLQKVRRFIDEERLKVQCKDNVYDSKRHAIYSEAFNEIVENVTVYKDILADTKREYEDCIAAIINGQRESFFLTKKIKTLANLPSAIAGYRRRKSELEEKLEILETDNENLQRKLNSLKKSDENPKKVKEEVKEVSPQERLEHRPIPGLTVEEWTDVLTLQHAVSKLDSAIETVVKKQKTSYVPLGTKIKTEETLTKRMEARNNLIKEVKELHHKNLRLKTGVDAVHFYRRLKLEDPDFDQDPREFVLERLANQQSLERKISWINDDGELAYDDDDPSKEKEAELILEYIDKFNELFNEKEYDKAAVHAANSPRGVLRVMETLNRFREASITWEGTPTPLLLYAVALMNSSTAQCHVADKAMSIVCARCALDENRPDLLKHWTTSGTITPCDEIAQDLVKYSESIPEYKSLCLVVANKIFSDIGNHDKACYTLYQLHYNKALLDYAKDTANYSKCDFLRLMKTCPDGSLIWGVCQPSNELADEEEAASDEFTVNPLPLRFDEAICATLGNEKDGGPVVVKFLNDLFHNPKRRSASLHQVVYDETDPSLPCDGEADWSKIQAFCEKQGLFEVALEIQSAAVVKRGMAKALLVIAQDEKEEFDYYT